MNKTYNILWKNFLKQISEFEDYMGYGEKEIREIGIENFLDFMDWKTIEDIPKYKTDKIKAIPCCHCGKHMTTFQLDMGLCDECKKLYNLKMLNEQISSSEPEAESAIVTSFVYFKDFRDLYLLDRDFDETLKTCLFDDTLNGSVSKYFLIEDVIGKNKIDEFIEKAEKIFADNAEAKEACSINFPKIKDILRSNNPKNGIRKFYG